MKNKNFKRKDGFKCKNYFGFAVETTIVPQKRMEKFNIKLKK